MILDALLRFSNAQDLSQVVADYPSTDVIDFGIASGIPTSANGGGKRDMGVGNPLRLLVQVIEAFASAGAATLQVHIEGAPDDGTGVPGAYVRWWSSPLYTIAQLVAGARLLEMDFPRPPQGVPVPRFVRLNYTVATATTTAGTVSSFIVLDRDDQMYNGSNNAVQGGYQAGLNVAN